MANPTTPEKGTDPESGALLPRLRARGTANSKRSASPIPATPTKRRRRLQPSPEDQAALLDRMALALATLPPWRPGTNPNAIKEIKKLKLRKDGAPNLDCLPAEILVLIAAGLDCDQKLTAVLGSCKHTWTSMSPINSSIWRLRFLDRWDAPLVDNVAFSRAIYQERTLILNHCIAYGNGEDKRIGLQLRTFRDMVLETFNPSQPHLPHTSSSRNLEAFLQSSKWMTTLLSSAFFSYKRHALGKPHQLFDALQVTFTFLLISPHYEIAKKISFSRNQYDLATVYSWGMYLRTLFQRLPESQQEQGTPPLTSHMFPGLRRPARPPVNPVIKFKFDINALLNIRNFWHHHMIHDDVRTSYTDEQPEDTFYRAVEDLTQLGHIPQPWTSPLQDLAGNLDSITDGKFIGFYSTVRSWPEKKLELIDIQTDAHEWNKSVDPLMLDFSSTSNINSRNGKVIWPDIFANIPCFLTTVPITTHEITRLNKANAGSVHFIRGFAPFMDLNDELLAHGLPTRNNFDTKTGKKGKSKSTGATTAQQPPAASVPLQTKLSARHPFTALRLRGVIHPIPSSTPTSIPNLNRSLIPTQTATTHTPLTHTAPLALIPSIPIPGFRRIVMVLYKPSVIELIKQLEFADEDYGSAFGVSVSSQASPETKEAIQVAVTDGVAELPEEVTTLLEEHLARMVEEREDKMFASEMAKAAAKAAADGAAAPDMADSMERFLGRGNEERTTRRAKDKLWTRHNTTALENLYHQDGQINWADMEYAYAYEGVLCPGGNVAMGRWWRVGLQGAGLSDGWEIDALGEGVPDAGVELDVDGDGDGDGQGGAGEGAGGPVAEGDGGAGGAANVASAAGGVGAASAAGGNAGRGARAKKTLERGPFVFWGMKAA